MCEPGNGAAEVCGADAGRGLRDENEGNRRLFFGLPELRKTCAVLALFFVAGSLRYGASEARGSLFSEFENENIAVCGRVVSVTPKDEGKAVLVIEARLQDAASGAETAADGKAGWDGRREKLQVTVEEGSELGNATGWLAEVRGTVYAPAEAGNPKAFDYSKYLRSRGIRMTMYADAGALKTVAPPKGIYFLLNRLAAAKSGFLEAIGEHMSAETTGLLAGILFGDKSDLDEAVYEDFQKNGIAHLLAVSGLHVSMIYGILNVLFRKPRSLAGNLPTMSILVMYAAVSGFAPSVTRAVFMIFVHIAARISHRRYDFLSCISFCGFSLLMYRPEMLFSAGFQLSFLAVLTLSVVVPKGGSRESVLAKKKSGASGSHASGSGNRPSGNSGSGTSVASGGGRERQRSFFRFLSVRILSEQRERMRRSVGEQLVGTFSMQAGMLPMTLYHFHYISIGAFFLNIPAIALSGLIVPLGAALMPASLFASLPELLPIDFASLPELLPIDFASLPELLSADFASLPEALCRLADGSFDFLCRMEQMLLEGLIRLNGLFAGTPLSYRYMASPPDGVFLFYYAALFFACSETGRALFRRSARRAVAVLTAAAVMCAAAGAYLEWDMMRADLIFVDVGQGDCAHLKADGGVNLMFDSGGSDTYDVGTNTLIPYFLANGVSEIDLAVVSHLHQDHCGGLRTMTQGVDVRRLLLSAVYEPEADSVAEDLGIPKEHMIFAAAGDSFEIGGVRLTVLAPERSDEKTYRKILEDSEDENELCLVVRAEYKGRSVLFTGDIGADYEKELAKGLNGAAEKPRADILKVAHHGSRYSTCDAFLSAVAPKAAVIQVGRNYYGHPSDKVIQRIEKLGAAVFRNDLQGAILMRLGKNIGISSVKETRKREIQ